MKIYVAHASNFPYEEKLYAPLRNSALANRHEFFFPHAEGNQFNTQELMKDCDLMIAEVSLPATGMGIEIGRAEAAGVPILCVYERGAVPASSLKYVTDQFIEYADADDLVAQLSAYSALRM